MDKIEDAIWWNTNNILSKFDDVVVETTDSINTLTFYSNGKEVKTISFSGGGGSSSAYISTTLSENIMVETGNDFNLSLDFSSPNLGNGTLKIFINDVDSMTTNLSQGETTTIIPYSLLSKGTNKMVVYVLDRTGQMSNSLTFYIRYGSTEVTTTFNPYTAYNYGEIIRYYFIATALDVNSKLTFYMKVDGAIQEGVACTSDVRGYFTFSDKLGVGGHECEAWVEDNLGSKSNILVFNLIILDDKSLVVATDTHNPVIEEGDQLILDYKVYMKNDNTLFITKTYIDNVLINTGNCTLETSYFKNSTLLEGTHTVKIEVWDMTEKVSDYITWNVTVNPSTYVMKEPVKAGALCLFSAKNKSNSDENKEVWIGKNQDGNNITATLTNFAYNSESGWVNDSLLITGNSWVEIPLKPLSNNAKYGFTLDVEFLSKQIGVEDAEVLTLWNDIDNCGIKITTEKLIIRSKIGNECSLYFSDNEIVNAIFVIDREEKVAKIYINGVMCEAFALSDYESEGIKHLEDFTVNSNIFLGGYNKNGYSTIKNFRVYEVALSTDEILNNYISNKIDKSEQKALVEFQKGDTLPTLTIYCDWSGLGKDDAKPCNITYISPDTNKYGESFNLTGKTSTVQYQGTSSMAYPIKNYKIKLKDKNGSKYKYNPYGEGKAESTFTLKCDFMSSGHWQNTGLAKWVSDNLYNYDTKDKNSINPMKWHNIQNGGTLTDTRETINGFPCRLILINDGTTPLNEGQAEPTAGSTKDMGIFNFNLDKACTDSFGLDTKVFPQCISYEVASNSDTSAGAFVPYSGTDSAGELAYLQNSFELRYPDDKEVGKNYGYLGMTVNGTFSGEYGLKRVIDWVGNADEEEFVTNFEKYFNKEYTFRYYLLVIVLGMVDNLGKNMMFDSWDGKIWYPRFYDMDTICSYDNSGQIKFDVDIEMAQGYWNTSSSRLWTKIRDYFHEELVETYNSMRSNGLSYQRLMDYFYGEQISKIPQKYYNMDADVKYIPYASEYLGKAHGDGYEHLKRWLKNRLIFTDTLFDYAPSYNNDILTIRANTTDLMTLVIETYTPVYQHLSWYNNQMDKVKVDGKKATIFTGRAQTATDQEVLIYGGSNIKRISGISSMNPDQLLIGGATRLVELIATDCPLLTDINSNKANLSPHIYLNKLDLSNCPNLGGTLRLNNSALIQDINVKGTSITSIQLYPHIRNLSSLRLPNTITDLTLKDVDLLNTLEFDEGASIDKVSLTNCNNLINVINFDFKKSEDVTLDNSFDKEELYMSETTNLSLRNMTNLKRIVYIPNNEYAEFDINKVANGKNYKVTTFNTPNLTEFLITAPQRQSYKEEDNNINPNSVFTANTLDLGDSQFRDIKLLCTSDIYNFKLPTSVKNFYCDSAFDIDTTAITDGGYKTIHEDLIEPYTTNYNSSVKLNGETPNIIPSSANGSLIFNMYSNNTTLPTSASPYMWDLIGLNFDNFYTFGMNNYIKKDSNGNITMPQRMEGYSVRLCNANITPTTHNTMFYPKLIDTTLPITGKLDYTKYLGNTLAWAYAYTTDSVSITPYPSINMDNISLEYNKLYGTNYVDTTEVYIKKDRDINKLTTNTGIKTAYIELTSSNYKTRFNDVLKYYPNCNDIYLYDDGTVTTLENMFNNNNVTYKSQIKKVSFLQGYFANLTSASAMFQGCTGVTEIDFTNLNTSNVTTMAYMFMGCTSLTTLNFTNFNTSKVTTMVSMFNGCKGLTSLDLSSFNTAKVTSMFNMFTGCNGLTSLNVSSFNTENVITMASMFNGCKVLTTLDLSNFNTAKVTTMLNMFNGCNGLTSLNVSNFDTSSVTNMSSMFSGCNVLTSLNLSSFNTENVTGMNLMFNNCTRLETLDISNFTTPKVGLMQNMFYNCSSLTSLDTSKFITSSATNMGSMFSGCSGITTLDVGKFNTEKVTDMSSMFAGCSGITTLDLSSFNTSSVTTMASMFSGCSALTTLKISNFNLDNCGTYSNVWAGCSKLADVNANKCNLTTVTKISEQLPTRSSSSYGKIWAGEYDSIITTNLKAKYWNVLEVLIVAKYTSISSGLRPTFNSGYECVIEEVLNSDGRYEVTIKAVTNFTSCSFKDKTDLYSVDSLKITTSVTNISELFYNCSNLISINTQGWDTSKVTKVSSTFSGCSKLTSLNLANINLEKCTTFTGMFTNCSELRELRLDSWENSTTVTNVINTLPTISSGSGKIYTMLTLSITLPSGWSISIVPNSLCVAIYTSTASGVMPTFNTNYTGYTKSEVTNSDGTYTVTILSNSSDNMPTSMKFTEYKNLKIVQYINAKKITDMSSMFEGCSNITTVENITDHRTGVVTNMSNMFNSCTKLTYLDLTNIDTRNVTSMDYMFSFCEGLKSLNISNWNTSNVTNMRCTFNCCYNLTSVDASNWNTSNVTTMQGMFNQCNKLTTVDVSNWNTSNVTTMDSMFGRCTLLTTIDVSNFNTSNVTSMLNMFTNCTSLTSLDLSSFNTSNVTDTSSMFAGCSKITTLTPPAINMKISHSLSPCTLLTASELVKWLNSLPIITTSQTLTLGSTLLAKLSSTEKAIATNKGWTLA